MVKIIAPKYVECLTSNSPHVWTVGVIYKTEQIQEYYPRYLTIKGNDGDIHMVMNWGNGGNSFKFAPKIAYDRQSILKQVPQDSNMGLKVGDSVTAINRSNSKGFSDGIIVEPICGWYSEYTIEGFSEIDGRKYAKLKNCDAYLLVSELKKVELDNKLEVNDKLELIYKINQRIAKLKAECEELVLKEFDLHDTGEYDIARNIQDKRINNYSTISALKWVLNEMQ